MAPDRIHRLPGTLAWKAYLAAGGAAIGLYYLLPVGPNEVLYTALSLSGVLAILWGIRRNRPVRPLPWYLFAAGLLLSVVADAIWSYEELVLHIESPFPSVADGLYLAGYPPLAAGLVLLAKRLGVGGGRATLFDAAVVTANFGVPAWLYLIGPYARDETLTGLERTLLIAYPALDLVLLFALARCVLAGRVRTPAFGMVLASVVSMLVSDVLYIGVSSTTASGDWINAGWLAFYVLWGAAALHPSMAALLDAPAPAEEVRRWNLPAAALALTAALAVPATLLQEAAGSSLSLDETGVAAGAFLLVVVRLAMVVRDLQRAQGLLIDRNGRLRESEKRFREVVENLPLVTYRTALDEKATPLWISPQAEAMFGYTTDEWLGDPNMLERITHPDDLADVRRAIAAQNQTGERIQTEYRLFTRDGRAVWLHDMTVVLPDEQGRPLEALGFAFDITERKEAERALRESEERFRRTFEDAPDGMALVATDGRFLRVNPALCAITGYSEAELLASTWAQLVRPEDVHGERELVRRVLAGDELPEQAERPIVHKAGHEVWVLLSVSFMRDQDGRPGYVIAQLKDVTARKLAEAERERAQAQLAEQNERLLELDRAKDEFISLVSHDLRTPLTSIMGYLDLLLEEDPAAFSDEHRRFLGVIDRNSERLLQLVNDLLFAARLAAGREALVPQRIDLAALAGESVEGMRPAAADKGVELSLEVRAVPSLEGDPERLGRLLENLLSNAVKFTPAGGRVRVRTGVDGERALLEVTDTGIGIAPEEQDHLFERFFRTSSATQQAIPGTGLGLYMVKRIAEAHGGDVEVRSVEGAGTTFRVFLPLRPAAGKLADAA